MPFITRAFYCDGYHRESKQIVVYGKERKSLLLFPIELGVIQNITPHIVSFLEPVEGTHTNLALTCGVVGCGLELIDPNDTSKGIRFLEVKKITLPIREFRALLKFTNTGYELNKHKRK